MQSLTPHQAYLAMFAFLEGVYQSTKSDEVGALLGSMAMLRDGMPADAAIAEEWSRAVSDALSGTVEARLFGSNGER